MTVNVAYKLLQTILSMEHLCLWLPVLWDIAILICLRTHIREDDLYSGIQECELTHTTCDDVVLICRGGEDTSIRPELLTCTALVRLTDNLHIIERLTLLVFLLIYLAVTENL